MWFGILLSAGCCCSMSLFSFLLALLTGHLLTASSPFPADCCSALRVDRWLLFSVPLFAAR